MLDTLHDLAYSVLWRPLWDKAFCCAFLTYKETESQMEWYFIPYWAMKIKFKKYMDRGIQ